MDLNRFALRLKLKKVDGSMVHHVALMINYLRVFGIDAKMVTGFALADGTACWHVWAEADQVYDLSNFMFPDLKVGLASKVPDGYQREDLKDDQSKYITEENQRLADLFRADEKAFWKEAPMKVRKFSVV